MPLVINATLTWRHPHYTPFDKFFYVETEDLAFFTQLSLAELAKHLSGDLEYEPRVGSQTFYADGYFGRQIFPVEVWKYDPLTSSQIEVLEHILSSREQNL